MKKSLRIKTPAKVNLYLGIVRRRPDGYHDIETVFQAIDLCDELILSKTDGEARLHVPGRPDLEGEGNLVMKAVRALESATGQRLPAVITLTKAIPVAAGLGGGSSDAAAALSGLSSLFDLTVSEEDMIRMAVALGADVPFFLRGGCAVGEGIGERLTSTRLPIDYEIILINPGVAVPTAFIYREFDRGLTGYAPEGRLNQMLRETNDSRRLLYNDLQPVAEKAFPEILEVRQIMNTSGLSHVLMSGSGPTVFAICDPLGSARKDLEKHVRPGWSVLVTRPVAHGVIID